MVFKRAPKTAQQVALAMALKESDDYLLSRGKIWVFVGKYFDPGGDLSKTREYVSYAYAPSWDAKHPEDWLEGSSAALQAMPIVVMSVSHRPSKAMG